MNKPLTEYDLNKLDSYIDKLNAQIGLHSETIKDVKVKIKEARKKLIKDC